jgi:hypothetical protein
VELPRGFAHHSAVADHRVAVHAQEPSGGPHAGALGQMVDQVAGRLRGQAAAEQGRALPLGEAGRAGAAGEQPRAPGLAGVTAAGPIAESPLARIRTIGALAAEAGQVLPGGASMILGRVRPES